MIISLTKQPDGICKKALVNFSHLILTFGLRADKGFKTIKPKQTKQQMMTNALAVAI
jgi:hypothetical protein